MTRISILALLLLGSVASAQADDTSAVIDRYVAWRGGAAYERLRSIHLRAALDTAGLHGTEEVWVDRAGNQRIDSDLGVIAQTQVVAPQQSWDIAPSGQVETMSQSDMRSLRRDAALQFADVLRGHGGATVTSRASETRDGRSWSVLRVSFGDDDTYDVLLDPKTGALGGYDILEDRQRRFESFGEWRVVDGVRMPFLQITKTQVPGGDQTVKVASMALNVVVARARLARPAPVHKAAFANGASSTGWIDFEFYAGNRIFFPAKIDGHDTVVLLDSGATVSGIDKAFAAAIGVRSRGAFAAPGSGGIDTMSFASGVEIRIGALTLRDIKAACVDFAPVAKRIGHPMPFVLGNELFNELAVDIDFARRRLAFRDPAGLARPAGAVEVPLIRVRGNRAVPVSIEGAKPVQIEFDLGNGSALVVYPAYYRAHKLLEGRRVSQMLGGAVGGFHPEAVASLDHVSFAGVDFRRVPTVFSPDTLSDDNSNLILGSMGLPVFSRFRLIVDYSRDRLYATPDADAAAAPFAKDRLGLFLVERDAGLSVEFVAPGSPAQSAGFKAGDRIARIDGKKARDWSESALAALRYASAGTALTFALDNGRIRRVTSADFF